MSTNYFSLYQTALTKYQNDEKMLDAECYKIFQNALAAGDRRMAVELLGSIESGIECGAPTPVVLRDFALLTKYFPDLADKLLDLYKN